MKAINDKERKKKILQFVLFFSVTIIAVFVLMLFNFSMPKELNARQRKQLSDYHKFTRSENLFVKKIALLDSLISKVGSQNSSLAVEEADIVKQINFDKEVNPDSSLIKISKGIDKLMKNYLTLKLFHEKYKLKGGEKDEDFQKLKQNLEESKEKIEDLEDELKDCESKLE